MKSREASLSHDTLTRVLDYDPATGVFVWKVDRGNQTKAGQRAGAVNLQGYLQISVGDVLFRAHRLAWFYLHKTWPKTLDHINGARTDNRAINLREVTDAQNAMNSSKSKSNSTGFKGVTRHKAYPNKFMAQIMKDRKQNYLGIFDTAEEAHAAYVKASHDLHGEHGRTE